MYPPIAKLNQVPVIFSEDLPPNAVLDSVRFINPFAENFEIDEWT